MVRAFNDAAVYFNAKGNVPPVVVEPDPAPLPPDSPAVRPKLITDTTLRDGAQDPRIALFPHEARVRYFDLLHKLDNGCGVIESTEVFIYQKRDLWVLEKLLERGYKYPKVTTWTRANPRDLKLLKEVSRGRVRETGMLASASDHHILDKLNFKSKADAADKYLAPVWVACELGIRPRVHLEDATKADFEGWVIPFMQRALETTEGRARFRICDTLGTGVPDPFAAVPHGIPKVVSKLVRETGAELEFHGHNDFGYATANSIAAWTYGCKRVNVAFAGLGERTGNTPLEQVLVNYIRLYGDPGFNLEALTEMAELINHEVIPLSGKLPVIGEDIFTTQAGIHQAGLERQRQAPGGLIYLPYDPQVLGRKSVEFNRIGALSGNEGIASILNAAVKAQTGSDGAYTSASPEVRYIYKKVQEAYDGQYDAETKTYVGYRKTFFEPHEVLALAREYEAAVAQERREAARGS